METLGSQNPDLSLVLSSCEPELQELMRQIDIMISQQRAQWEAELQTTHVQLKTAQEELSTSRELLQRKELEISVLQKQQESTKTELISKYEQQLQKVCEELNKSVQTQAEDRGTSETLRRLGTTVCPVPKTTVHPGDTQQEPDTGNHTSEVQRSVPKQREHQECCSELQRVQVQLEKTQDSLHSQELELERLRPLEAWPGRYQRDKRVHAEERDELHATLDTHDSSARRASLERQRLRNETERLNQLLRAKDHVIRSLEDCLAAHGGAGVDTMRMDLEKTTSRLQSAQSSEAQLRAELSCVKDKLETVSRRREDQSQTEQELKRIKAEYESCTAEMKKLREELQRAQQTHSGEVQGMRREVSKLTGELHQRDRTISSHSGSLCSVREQLRGEQRRAEQRNAQLQITQAQLDSLREENLRLKSLLQSQDSNSPKRGEASVAALRDSSVSSVSRLEQENLQLRQALTDVKSRLSVDSQEKLQTTLQRDQSEQRKPREPGSGSSHEGEIQKLFKQLQVKEPPGTGPSHSSSKEGSKTSQTQSPPRSLPSSSSSCSELNLGRRSSASSESAAEGPGCTRSDVRERATGADSLPSSPSEGMVSRFLEEESLRSKELLQILDSHIQNMAHDNTRTVWKYQPNATATSQTTATSSS
ncbi:hypothetical protein WMY93_024367 [Mugilogobius chulae]|uniref:Centrosomal protein Cep63/Deup1 N-terminal domain-containing protein n=1 Tax=Mugilogobius chulae TaxID=88201 RepID=A0AAW0NAG9_9GOBI